MNLADTEGKSASGAVVASTTNTHLTGTRLIIARIVWLALVVPTLGLFVISLPVYYQQLQTACFIGTACGKLFGALPAQGLQTLSTTGLSASGYAALFTIFSVIIAAIWCAVGFIIFWRRSDDWLALLAAFFLVMSSITPSSGNATYLLALAYPVLALPFSLLGFLGQTSFFVFLLLFPNGRLVPRWMGLILLLVISNAFLNTFPSTASTFETNWPGWLNLLVNLVIFGTIIYSQIYRYRRISTPVQRQQTKWIVLGVTAAIGFYIGLLVIDFLIPSLQNPNSLGEVIGSKIYVINIPVVFFLIPLSIGIAILRYRLYDIDIIIHRTLVYSTLTVLLAMVYFGLIITLQAILRGLISQTNGVAIVISTLAIYVLFHPMRYHIQRLIDRRFYRHKYDAARTLAAFSATIRDEVNLEQLCTK